MPPKLISINNNKNIIISNELIFFVNGKKVIEKNPDPECTLLTYLRETLRLCGTKLGCAEGGCGACTVMLSEFNRNERKVTHKAVNACITPVCRVHGCAIVTVEGIGSTKTKLHPAQERIARAHGSQCGFCTPGIVMSMYSLLRNSPTPTMKDLEITFQGNLCRCTGYRPIIEGYRTFTTKDNDCPMGENCCKNSGNGIENGVNGNGLTKEEEEELFKPSEFGVLDCSQEPIFPPELKLSNALDNQFLIFRNIKRDVTWYRPITINELLRIKHENSNAKIVNGNTEVGIEVKFKKFQYSILIMPNLIPELIQIEIGKDGVRFGASVTLDDMNETLTELINTLPEEQTRLFKCIVNMLHYFAGKQVRNVASIGGNIMTGSPISDLIPIFTAAEIELEVESYENGCRNVYMGNSFFIGYRKNILKETEILKSIFIPISHSNQYYVAYKQAKRREDDIAIVNFALMVTFSPNTNIIENINLAFGGMAPTVVMGTKTSEKLCGKCWTTDIIEIVNTELSKEIPLSPSAPGGMIHYRQSLTLSLFFKAYLYVYQELEHDVSIITAEQLTPTLEVEISGANVFHSLEPKSAQFFERDITVNDKVVDAVGKPLIHAAAFKQVCGEAVYCDDTPKYENELYLGFVLSTKAHAKIIEINASEAEQLEGVHLFLSAKDIGEEENKVGPVFHDEELFRRNDVTSTGQIIGVIVADDQRIAQRACGLVKVTYENLLPVILTIEDAIREKSFFPGERSIVRGDIDEAFRTADHIVEGDCRLGGQEHFYLETHAAIAVPRENDELEIICSVQHPTEIQKLVSHITGLPASHVVARVKRMGGGFGGKESRGILTALPVALAAHRLGRPVRCMLDRDEDMAMTGTRHPFYLKYKASCNGVGKITGCDVEIYSNAGYSRDLSFSILERAMFHFENAYYIPNVRVKGWACRTNLPSNTAFRGFGGPQGMFAGEHIIRDVARIVGKDEIEVATLNLYREGQLTHYNQELINCNLIRCWDQCFYNSDYLNRKLAIEKFNKNNRWRKRGISMVPTKFGIAFTALFLNQAGALLHVYADGSVLLSHGGTEMGQGLHTKMIQVASRALNIPVERIHISETSTDKVPNTSATAASAGSDLNGMAVLNACNTLMERLNPYKEKYPDEGWNSWINKAYMDRVSLSATGFYATPNIGYDFQTNSGNPFNYFTYGAACSEVEIDCLTGDHQVIRSDIVMDLGTSINPAIDIGQIEGGFTQGYGLFTLEEMIYASNGTVLSKGPGTYKIPGFTDIPGEFNVSLLKGASNPRAVYSSKAVGEPPLFLASSIFFAIKEAIAAARKDENLSNNFKLNAPATAERIRMACEDKFTNQFKLPPIDSYIPWNIIP